MQITAYLGSLKNLASQYKVEAVVFTTVFIVSIILVWYLLSNAFGSSGFTATNPTSVRNLMKRDQFLNTREANFGAATDSELDEYMQEAAVQGEDEGFSSKKLSREDHLTLVAMGQR